MAAAKYNDQQLLRRRERILLHEQQLQTPLTVPSASTGNSNHSTFLL